MKVFCIGANKSGTTSLTAAMKRLNYKNMPENIKTSETTRCFQTIVGLIYMHDISEILNHGDLDNYDFYEDVPFSLFDYYVDIDKKFPDAKFILTVRDSEKFFNSVLRWIDKYRLDEVYSYIYGTKVTLENKKAIIETYEKRNNDIIKYFENKPNKLLVFNTETDGYEKLCLFLEKPLINEKFPHENINTTQ